MPDNEETAHLGSGWATAPPSGYSLILASATEGYSAPSTNSSQQHIASVSQAHSTDIIDNFLHQRAQLTDYNLDYSISSLSHLSSTSNHQFQSHHSEEYSTSSILLDNSSVFPNSNNSDSINVNNTNSNTNFRFTKTSSKGEEEFSVEEDTLGFESSEQLSSAAFNFSKIPKPGPPPSSRQDHSTPFPHPQAKYSQKEAGSSERNSRRNLEGSGLSRKDEEVQRNGTKIKNGQDACQEVVTDSFLQLLQRRNGQDSLSYDLGDLSPILVSLTSRYKSEDVSGFKKDSNEDLKLMNDFLAKLILEKEEKRFKALDEKKKLLGKETFEELANELNERRAKRDAMSHYQEDKNHKRASAYGDYNQWEYFGQQDIQPSNRRGHFSFGSAPQQHSVGWTQMGIGLPRQANPYYSNPHVMPAHAHSDYRYNQWNNPNHKPIPNVHNAHSQNTPLPQTKMDLKHHSDISSSVQDFGLPIGSTSEFSKFRAASRDLLRRSSPSIAEKAVRAGVRSDLLTALSPGVRNSSLRAPPMASHPKAVINNPLSDLQMLVTTQEGKSPPRKGEGFQQESVDLSAHSDVSKQKERQEEGALKVSGKEVKDLRTSVGFVQNKQVGSDSNESEKPVELTAKNSEKSCGAEGPPPAQEKNTDSKKLVCESEKVQKEETKKSDDVKTEGAVEKSEGTKSEADIPKNSEMKVEEKVGKEVENAAEAKTAAEESSDKTVEKPQEVSETAEKSEKPEAKCEEESKSCKRKAEEEPPGEKKKALMEVEPQKSAENVEEDNADTPTVTSTSTEAKPLTNDAPKKTPKRKPSKKSRMGRLSSGQSSGSERSLPCKKWKGSGGREEGRKRVKKSLCDVMERRGPFLHVVGSRECPAAVSVVNFPKGDDEDEKDKSSGKKQILNSSRTKHQNELDYRGRSRNGLYCSTLSARYDTHTKDYTWICVFCKKGPHHSNMGDLFGPYIISEDESTCLGDFSGDEKDISDAQKRGGRNKKSLRSNNMVEHFQKMSKKLRRTQSTESCLTGMTVISDDHVDQLRYEVWVHEQCAVWSPNVFLIGSRIIGMQEAIWCSVKTMCSKCGVTGANIGCVYRNCPNRSHYHCAKECGWSLQQETFISTCHIHKPRS